MKTNLFFPPTLSIFPDQKQKKIDLWFLSLVTQMVKNLPAMQETWVRLLGWEDPLEKEMVTYSSILAWEIPCIEEPRRLQTMGSQRVRHNWATEHTHTHTHTTCHSMWLRVWVLVLPRALAAWIWKSLLDLPSPVTRELPTSSSPCFTWEGEDVLVTPWQIVKALVQA